MSCASATEQGTKRKGMDRAGPSTKADRGQSGKTNGTHRKRLRVNRNQGNSDQPPPCADPVANGDIPGPVANGDIPGTQQSGNMMDFGALGMEDVDAQVMDIIKALNETLGDLISV
ncbi:hypothetical protein PIB30_047645 [Stylosanthes scabra]|uniref:Uncharacterized protein n=1 Tax=Stylosanthes scabra TaxID=79078 RepID=A0ABU6UIZ4_9FABA|nr:hypothetical protein [Stylosanthes scabra]